MSERPSVANLAFPAIITNLMYSLVVIVQTRFVGDLGEQAIAAVAIGMRVFFATQALLMAISAGTTALVARSWGAENYTEAANVTKASLVLSSMAGLICAVPGVLFPYQLASIFGVDEVTTQLAAENIRWISVFNIAFAVSYAIGAALRAAGDAWTPFYLSLIVNVINIPLLYALVPGNWGMPAWGVKGAAIAGGLAGTIGSALSIVLWVAQVLRVKWVKGVWLSKRRFAQLIDVGYPAGVEMVVFQIGYFVFLYIVGNYYGDTAFAAYSLSSTLFMVCMVVGFGFSVASATLSGQHLGAGQPDQAVKSGLRTLAYGAFSMFVLSIVVVAFTENLVRFFLPTASPEFMDVSYKIVWMVALSTPLMAIEFSIGGTLRGAGDTRFPMISTMIGLLGVRCTLAVFCVLVGLDVIYLFGAMVIENLVKGALLLLRFRTDRWKTLIQVEPGERISVDEISKRKSDSATSSQSDSKSGFNERSERLVNRDST